MKESTAYVIMGVSGCGKSTVGIALAAELACPFIEGDDYHPPENIAKMSHGIPLDDVDRVAWLKKLTWLLAESARQEKNVVMACSALKKKYRDQLRSGHDHLHFAYLKGSYDVILDRMQARQHPYMQPELLSSQFQTLEEPGETESDVLTLSIEQPVSSIVSAILSEEQRRNRPGEKAL